MSVPAEPVDPARSDPAPDPGTAGLAPVPDVPDAVLGWRTWRVGRRPAQRHVLFAPLTGTPWPAGRALRATCASPRHRPPGPGCGCGLHALADPAGLGWSPSDHEVLGVVALWGEVVEGERGWRASHGYPRVLLAGPGVSEEQCAAIARRYGVGVHRAGLPARELAGLLGSDPSAAAVLRAGPEAERVALLDARRPDWSRAAQRRRDARAAAEARHRTRRRRVRVVLVALLVALAAGGLVGLALAAA